DVRMLSHSMREWMRDIDTCRKHRARHIELGARQGYAVFNQMILDRENEEPCEPSCRISKSDYCAAVFDKAFDLRKCLFNGDSPLLALIPRRNVADRRGAAATAASCAITAGDAALDENEHIVLCIEITGIKHRRKHAFKPELELLENPARPS